MRAPITTSRPTIVCVDDDRLVLRSLREQLQRGVGAICDIELAESAEEALQLLQELVGEGTDVPLLVSDQILPGMHGSQFLAHAHKAYPDMLKILLSGQIDAAAVSMAVNEAGLYRVLGKPWREDELVFTVREALRQKEQDRALQAHTTQLQASHRELEQSIQLLHATMDATLDGLLVINRQGDVTQVNRQFLELWAVPDGVPVFGPAAGLIEHMRRQLVEPGALALAGDHGDGVAGLELVNGKAFEYLCRPHAIDGLRVGTVCSFRDISERQRSLKLIRHQAFHDPLTGLANRNRFDAALAAAIGDAKSTGRRLAVLFLDLDRFKRINDTLGHVAGDELLCTVARRLCRRVREGDLVSRWGGDEFVILLPDIEAGDDGTGPAARILEALAPPLQLSDTAIHVSASVGCAVFPDDGEDALTLMKHADLALYKVKEDGRNGVKNFRHVGTAEALPPLSLEIDLHRAFERGELEIQYQPQIDTRCGKVTHVEALARWQHPALGWVSPERFIPLIEEMGLIVPFGEWVLNTACKQAAAWHAAGHADVSVSVNVSALQIERSDLFGTVRSALAKSGMAASRLELEITEATALRNPERTAEILCRIRNDGVEIAVDDFGTGYASLSYLKQLPCQTLKIDRSFIIGLDRDPTDAAIIGAVVHLAEQMGLRLVAEGVETEQIKARLQHMRCWSMQGHLFSAALTAQAMAERLGMPGAGTKPNATLRQAQHVVPA